MPQKGKARNRGLAPTPPVAVQAGKPTPALQGLIIHHEEFPVIGIGASAGGLSAFESFFSGMPSANEVVPSMSFVLIQHLAPDHASILAEIIRRYTNIPVYEVVDGMVVNPNCIYIIPPNKDMALLNGTLQLLDPVAPRGQRLPIDFFFRSLAQDQRERAIGIVLSGTGSDGTLGVRAIKGEGGLVIVQTPDSTEYDGMPRSALATGLVDYELLPVAMVPQIIAYVRHAFNKPGAPVVITSPKVESALNKIFILIRHQTGHDFSKYKLSTIKRRIERRMAIHQIDTIEAYVEHIGRTPIEVDALFRDLLIGVTKFFRDPEVFQTFQQEGLPKLFEGKSANTVIRIWSPGCSTGEEPYSIAMLIQDYMETMKLNFKVQIFATDINREAIATGRTGMYPASIVADLSPDRVARFFTASPPTSTYRIHETIRAMLLFSEQDVIKDPPFSKLDLISCRNLMIYMGGELQKHLIRLFHYALNPDGMLFLGNSETVGEFKDLFKPLNFKAKLYQRSQAPLTVQHMAMDWKMMPVAPTQAGLPPRDRALVVTEKSPLRELTEQALLMMITQSAALVNGAGDILYLHGRAGMYLELPQGDTKIVNILKLARDGLGLDLTVALNKAASTRELVKQSGVRIKTNGQFTTLNLAIRPLPADPLAARKEPLYLIVLEEVPEPVVQESETTDTKASHCIKALKQELQDREEFIRNYREELETSNEELRSSNEEMQSINEELQSSNEELETAKEELQSLSEELLTVNSELETNVKNLEKANNDIVNLLSGTGIATVFITMAQRIIRFTPAISEIINLLPSDLGRPLAHFVSSLKGYNSITADVQSVFDTMTPKELEVESVNGRHYMMRIQLYRTMNNAIEGAVINFIDITALKRAHVTISEMRQVQEQLARTSELLEHTGEVAKVGGWELDLQTGTLFWSKETYRIHEIETHLSPSVDQALSFYTPDMKTKIEGMVRAAIEQGTSWDYEAPMTTAKGHSIWVRGVGSAVIQEGKTIKLRGAFLDITALRQRETELHHASELSRLAVVVRDSYDAITVQDLEGRILAWNPGAVRLYGWSEAEALAMNIRELVTAPQREESLALIKQLCQSTVLAPYRLARLAKDGRIVDVMLTATALVNEAGTIYAIATTEREITKPDEG